MAYRFVEMSTNKQSVAHWIQSLSTLQELLCKKKLPGLGRGAAV